jgi:hypothetical protein
MKFNKFYGVWQVDKLKNCLFIEAVLHKYDIKIIKEKNR